MDKPENIASPINIIRFEDSFKVGIHFAPLDTTCSSAAWAARPRCHSTMQQAATTGATPYRELLDGAERHDHKM